MNRQLKVLRNLKAANHGLSHCPRNPKVRRDYFTAWDEVKKGYKDLYDKQRELEASRDDNNKTETEEN